MTFPKTVTLTWTDPNPPGSDYIVTRDGAKIGTSSVATFVDSVQAPGTYVYGVAAHNSNETSPETKAQIALISLLPVANLTITVN